MQALRSLISRSAPGGTSRFLATGAFLTSVEQVQQQLQTAQDRRAELLRYGKELYESEQLDDLPQSYTPSVASKLCQGASQLRINVAKGQIFTSLMEESVSARAEEQMDVSSLARIVHSCLVLRSPYLYEVLFTYTAFVIEKAPTMDAVTVAVLLNAYGRSGMRHERLYAALCDAGAKALKDPRVSLAHIANVAYAVSRVQFAHRPLLLTLRDQAVRKAADATPIVAITLLDAFAELHMVDEDLFNIYEKRLLGQLDALQAPLLASLFSCLVRADRGSAEVMETLGTRVVALSDTFDAASIAKVSDAYYRSGVMTEEVLGALAERACKIAADFRPDEIALLLNALSSFDLFDGELFPLLFSRLCTLYTQGNPVGVGEAATVLASAAAVQERNDELVHICTQIFAAHPGAAMSGGARIDALWACASLGVHNEAQMKLVEEARTTPALLTIPPGEEASITERRRESLTERRQTACKVYNLPI